MNNQPLVSVCCITYNHEKYIREAIEGFLMQETSFPFEIIIHDDASIDGTQDIIQAFAEQDERIVPILRKRNIKSTGVHVFPITYEKAQGKYIALCEGDDYWTDPLKLQKQVDFMEANNDCTLCFHASNHKYENNFKKSKIRRPDIINYDHKFTIEDAILGGGGFMDTNSVLFKRKYVQSLPEWVLSAPVGDMPLMLWLSMHGKLGYIDDNMSVYRVNVKDSWSHRISYNCKMRKIHYKQIQQFWYAFDQTTDYKYHLLILKKLRINKFNYINSVLKLFWRNLQYKTL